jgi:hypothetical protein
MPRLSSFESVIRPILGRFAKEIARAVERSLPKETGRGGGRRRRGMNPEVVHKLLKQSKDGSAVGELADKPEKRAKIVGVKRNARWHAA